MAIAITTVIFDMDGTVLNTLEDITNSVNFAMALYGYPKRTISEIKAYVGGGIGRLIEQCIPGGKLNPRFEECLEDFRQFYELNMRRKTRPYDGVPELLSELKRRGYKMAIVSNKFDAAVKELTPLYFGDAVAVSVGESPGVSVKPAPDIVYKALDELNSAPGEAVYVGDSDIDAETARNAGLPFVGVTWGFRDRKLLEAKGARWIIDKPGELLEIVKS